MTATAIGPEERTATEQARIAAAIRRIVTPRFIEQEIEAARADPETARVLPLLLHLRPDRVPEAIAAHRALVKQLRSDLAACGIAGAEYFRLVELLYSYLDASGYRLWEGQGWRLTRLPGLVTP